MLVKLQSVTLNQSPKQSNAKENKSIVMIETHVPKIVATMLLDANLPMKSLKNANLNVN